MHRVTLLAILAVLFGLPAAPASATGPSPSTGRLIQTSAVPGYRLPVDGPAEVLTAFRPPAVRWGAGHRGVDLAADVGAPVRAAGAGTVVFAGTIAGRGVVSIQHTPGLRTTYEPVTARVSAGEAVAAGAVIGTLQAGHPSCLPRSCLHWGARAGPDEYLDPMLLLSRWRVQLLPWDGLG